MTTQLPPFLTTRADGSLAYQATAPGDLRNLLETIRQAPELALKIEHVVLSEDLDGQQNSGLLDFVLEFGTKTYIEPLTDEGYESISDELKDFEQEETDMVNDDNDDDTVVDEHMGNSNHGLMTAPSVTVNYPVTDTSTLPTIRELSESFNTVVDINEEHEDTASDTTDSSTPIPPAEVLQTAMDDFMTLAALTGVGHPIPDQFYLQLLFAMLSACVNVEVVKIPEAWAGVANKDVFQDLESVITTQG